MPFAPRASTRALSGSSSTNPSVDVSGLGITSGDIVVMFAYSNQTTAPPTADADSGGTWSTPPETSVNNAGGETMSIAAYWKTANGSEPTSYSISHASASYFLIVYVFSGSGTYTLDDSVAGATDGNVTNLDCVAPNGKSYLANSLNLVFGTKDGSSGGPEDYTQTLDGQGFTGVEGRADSRIAAGAYFIAGGEGGTFSSLVEIAPADGGDSRGDITASVWLSFSEGGGGASPTPGGIMLEMDHFNGGVL